MDDEKKMQEGVTKKMKTEMNSDSKISAVLLIQPLYLCFKIIFHCFSSTVCLTMTLNLFY